MVSVPPFQLLSVCALYLPLITFVDKKNCDDSGGTIATVLHGFEQLWSGGSEVAKKMGDPLLLTSPGGFTKAGSPGGLGYDSLAKCKRKLA